MHAQSAALCCRGLPEAWKRLEFDGPQADWPAGTFDLKGQFPPVLANVYLWPGLFNNTLPVYLNISLALGQLGPVSYLHVDCDLYGCDDRACDWRSMLHALLIPTDACCAAVPAMF